jgi:Lon-like protease
VSGYGRIDYSGQYGAPPNLRGRPSGPGLAVVICGFVAVLCAAVIAVVPARYAVLSPGPATNALGTSNGQRLIQVTGHDT